MDRRHPAACPPTQARGNRSPDATRNLFDALVRSPHLADWQLPQAIDAARIIR